MIRLWHSSQVSLTGSYDRMNLECERKREVNEGSEAVDLSLRKDGFPINLDGRSERRYED